MDFENALNNSGNFKEFFKNNKSDLIYYAEQFTDLAH